MSGRVCLLCEKPLGRVWLGADEDFCSREHRNQYRLRRGMDRLLEANKVASLMRRRENPKQITLFRAIDESQIARHGSNEMPFSGYGGEPPAEPHFSAPRDIHHAVALAADTHFADTLSVYPPPPLPARQECAAPPLGRRYGMVAVPSPPKQPYPRLLPANPADARGSGVYGSRRPRDTGVLWKSAWLLHLDPGRHVAVPAFHPYVEPHGCLEPHLTGPRGYSLRVSQGSGFRVQLPRLRSLRLDLSQPAVPESDVRYALPPNALQGHLAPQPAAAPPPSQKHPLTPPLNWPPPEARMEWPGILSPSVANAYRGPELEVRPLGGAFTGFPPGFPPPSRHGGRDRARLRRLRVMLSGASPDPIVAYVPLGCAADGIDSRPGAPQDSRSSVEERFDDGWQNWQGSYHTWTVDAAGARTGGLALFTPSMEWRDYELEFFTRIETRSVTWVYRAVSQNDYYMGTLAALPGKGFSLTRRTVLRGKPGAALSAPLTVLPNPKSAYLIRLRIVGNQFTLSIDGQKIETWADNRFSMGGAGFLGAPDDRARIYWVRFYPGPAKESSRK